MNEFVRIVALSGFVRIAGWFVVTLVVVVAAFVGLFALSAFVRRGKR